MFVLSVTIKCQKTKQFLFIKCFEIIFRLGLGAAVPRQAYVAPSSDPIERKLRGNLDAAKRKAAKDAWESVPSARDESVDEDSEEELESRSKAISKRPTKNVNSWLPARKRKK